MKLLTKIKNLFKKDEEDNCVRTLHQAYKLGFQDGQHYGYIQGKAEKIGKFVYVLSEQKVMKG